MEEAIMTDLGDQRILYIQTNVEIYLNKFNALESKEKKVSWNWCTFLFGAAWMAYRKLYGFAAFFFITPTILDCILAQMFSTDIFYLSTSVLCYLIMAVCGGLYGDYWYKLRIDQLVRDGLKYNGEAKIRHLTKGGTSFVSLTILMIFAFVLNIIFNL